MVSVQVFAIITIPIYSQANSAYHSQDVCDTPQSYTLEKVCINSFYTIIF